MLEYITHIDQIIFHAINHGLKDNIFDQLLPLWRNQWTWIPLYVLLLFLAYQKYTKDVYKIVLLLAFSVLLTDQLSSQVIKKSVCRLRPCNDIKLLPAAENIIPCGTGFSFPSSHAANHTCVAILFGTLLFQHRKWLKTSLLLWAISIGFAQIYVGVHYPIDVVCGVLLGLSTSYFCLYLARILKIYTTI